MHNTCRKKIKEIEFEKGSKSIRCGFVCIELDEARRVLSWQSGAKDFAQPNRKTNSQVIHEPDRASLKAY